MACTHLSMLGTYPLELHSTILSRLSSFSQEATSYELTETIFQRDGTTAQSSTGSVADDHLLRVKALRTKLNPNRTKWFLQVYQKPEPFRLSPEVLSRTLVETLIESGDENQAISLEQVERQDTDGFVATEREMVFNLTSAMGFSNELSTLYQKGWMFQVSNPAAAPISSSSTTTQNSNSSITPPPILIEIYQYHSAPPPSGSSDAPIPPPCSNLTPTQYFIHLSTKFQQQLNPGPSTSGTGAGGGGGGTTHPSGGGGGGQVNQELKLLGIEGLKLMKERLKGLVDVGRVE